MSLDNLILLSFNLSGVIDHCYDDNGAEDNHWSGTKEEMERELGRPLSGDEITLLSLSRGFGPTPSLGDEETRELINLLWPKGNPHGLRFEWELLAQKLLNCRGAFRSR
jgi:hypothetical protein